MAALGRRFREDGLYTFVRWNTFFTNPPLTISEEELAEGFEIIDRALEITDAAVVLGARARRRGIGGAGGARAADRGPRRARLAAARRDVHRLRDPRHGGLGSAEVRRR
jgi:hypothetical protein